MNCTKLRRCALLALAIFAAGSAHASDYPTRPVRLVVPYAAGGATDQLARTIGDKLRARLNQPVIIENRPGAGTLLASEFVARQPPDGYTLFVTSSAMTSAPAMVAKLSFDPDKDFTPVAMLCTMVIGLVAANEVPAGNVKDLIAYMKSNPGKLNYASNGVATTSNLGMALFNQRAGVSAVHVPMKGAGQSLPELMANRVQIYFDAMSSSAPHVKAGKIKVLAIGSDKRSPLLPDVPTVAESGLPGFAYEPWFGIVGPAGMPRDVTERLNREINATLQDSDVLAAMRTQYLTPVAGAPEVLRDIIRADIPYWGGAAKAAGIKPE